MERQGFTLIELVMVIIILAILAVVAIPKFIDLRAQAREAAADGIVAAGDAGAQIWRSQFLIDSTGVYNTNFPTAANSACCFEDGTVPAVTGVTFSYNATSGRWTHTP